MIQAFARGAANLEVAARLPGRADRNGGRARARRAARRRAHRRAARRHRRRRLVARPVGRSAGIEIPVHLTPRQSFTTPWRHEAFPADAPLLISAAPYAHVRPEAQHGALFGFEYRWNTRQLFPEEAAREQLIEPVPPTRCRDPRFPSVTLLLLARQFGHQPRRGLRQPALSARRGPPRRLLRITRQPATPGARRTASVCPSPASAPSSTPGRASRAW